MRNYQLSPGGCGSCALEDFFGNHINYPRDSWNAHERDSNKPDPNSKVAYIYADPYNTILSYYRRNFLVTPYYHCQHISGDVNILNVKPSWTLEEFLQMSEDPFRLRDHFRGWYDNKNRTYDIMFIKYESLPYTFPKLCEWFNYDNKSFDFKSRNSEWESQSDTIKENLDRLYGAYREELSKLDDIVINPIGEF